MLEGGKKEATVYPTTIHTSSYYYTYVLILLYVSSFYYMCPHTTVYVSSHYCICIAPYIREGGKKEVARRMLTYADVC